MALIKRIAPAAVLAVAIVVTPMTASATNDDWTFEGGGWGHGVGLSQYGALGQAQEGRNASQILQYYYEGTSLADMPNDHWTRQPNGLRIGLVSNTASVDVRAFGGPVTVCLPADDCTSEQVINPSEHWRFELGTGENAGQCRLNLVGIQESTPWSTCSAATKDISPSNRVQLNGNAGMVYGRGTVRFDPSSSGFHAVVALPMEEYLYGLAEVPSSWPSEALKAQAIIGRSFALATAVARADGNGAVNATWTANCGCHLRRTSADQVYDGWRKEGAAWNGSVNDTNRQILTHPQSNSFANVATTYYSSSNGGWSENVEDVFGGSPQPWLKSVEDPWSADPGINPLANWSVKVTGSALASRFGWDLVSDVRILQGPPGVRIRFTGQNNGAHVESVLTGWQVRQTVLIPLGFAFQPVLGGNSSVRVSPYISSVQSPVAFIDIIGSTFVNDIQWLAQQDITRGCNPPENTRYCPDDHVTRGQMAAFLTRFLGLPAASQGHFTDIGGSTFEGDINRLAEAGITRGCNPPENTRFCPDDVVTREQMAAFIVRALGLSANTHSGFGDVGSSNTFFSDIGRLATAGVTRGCNPPANSNYCPSDAVTRGEMAAFIHRSDPLK